MPSPETRDRPLRRDTAALERALCRSALYEALALGFGPPDPETVARLATPEGAAGLIEAAGALDPALVPLVRALATGKGRADLDAGHPRFFGHTVRAEVPAYETEYGSDDLFQQPQEIADIAGFFAAFGLALAPDAHERPDHVRCECEFMMFLARKEAVALLRDDATMLAATRRAARLFLRDHLGRFTPAFASRLERVDEGGFYGRLAALAAAFVRSECAAVSVEPGPTTMTLRMPVDERIPMACGSCPVGTPGAAAERDDAD